jgi:hypothetical protein
VRVREEEKEDRVIRRKAVKKPSPVFKTGEG